VPKVGLVLLVFLLPARLRAESPPPPANQIVIVDGINFTTTGLPKSVRERERFFNVLEQKLRQKGWALAAPIAESLCSPARDCLGYLAQEAHAPYVLHLSGEGNLKVGYSLHLEVYSAATKRSQRTNTFCEICVTDGIATSAADLATGLLADAARDDRQTADAARGAELTTPATVAPPAVAQPRRSTWIPWSMLGAGAVAVGFGAWAIHEDGNPSGDSYGDVARPLLVREHRASQTMGIVAAAVGGAIAATGVLWLALTPSTAVSASTNHVALKLRF
jgi:hypothetical protein